MCVFDSCQAAARPCDALLVLAHAAVATTSARFCLIMLNRF